jgi:PTS system beta-glucosides-specific IIC component
MARNNLAETADSIITHLGGKENLQQVRHCATRLRCVVVDDSKVDKAALEATPGVISVVNAGGQTQVVIGNDVVAVYDAVINRYPSFADDGQRGTTDEPKAGGNPLTRAIEVVSSIFVPTLGVLAGTGLVKAFLSLGSQLGWFDPTSSSFLIFNAAADAFFYFLPVMLAYTTARRFKADVVTALTLGAALVYPSLVALMAAETPVTFLGIPVQQFSYTSSVIPIILAVWVMSHLERVLNRFIPVIVRKFVVPPLLLIIMLPLTLIVVGPLTIFLGNSLAAAITALFVFSPFVAGGLLGGIHQAIVIFGLHWGIIPVMIQEVSTTGLSYMLAPIVAAVLGQSAAALAASIKIKDKQMKALAVSSSVSGFLAGITEPAIYGINLRYKTPFVAGLVGGAVGGAIISGGGVAATAFVFPSLLGLPAFMTQGNTSMLFIGCGAAIIVAFVLTLLLPLKQSDGLKTTETTADNTAGTGTATTATAVATPTHQGTRGGTVFAPVSGTIVAQEQISDKVFASGSMGPTIGVIPTDGTIVSPLAGKVVAAMKTGHAYGIKGESGIEVLVHIGVDTVQMKGEGFTPAVSAGDIVGVGDVLAHVDFAAIRAAGYDTTTIIAVTNGKSFDSVDAAAVTRVGAGDPLFSVTAARVAA